MKKTLLSTTIAASFIVTLMTSTAPVMADEAEDRGLAIAIATDKRDQGWSDNTVNLKMVMKNAHNQSSTRELRIKTLEVIGEGVGDKSITIFDRPRDVKGTIFLSHTKIMKPDNQWLYLPALKRPKKISSANKSGPFLGSEFAFEDILSPEVAKFSYKYLKDEDCAAFKCYVIERIPLYENSGYTKQTVWIDKAHHRYMKIDFYDRKDSHLKTLTYSGYKEYKGKYWRAAVMDMINHQNGKSTSLQYNTYKFQTGLKHSDFTPTRFKKMR